MKAHRAMKVKFSLKDCNWSLLKPSVAKFNTKAALKRVYDSPSLLFLAMIGPAKLDILIEQGGSGYQKKEEGD